MRTASPIVALVIVVGLCAGCVAAEPSRVEVLRRSSPDGAVDAVVVETEAGATTGFGYLLFLPAAGCRPSGEPALRFSDATRSERAYGVGLVWIGSGRVSVEYFAARAVSRAAPTTVATAHGDVVVTSRAGVRDPTAPPGAMSRGGTSLPSATC